jgi:hypothetical protein
VQNGEEIKPRMASQRSGSKQEMKQAGQAGIAVTPNIDRRHALRLSDEGVNSNVGLTGNSCIALAVNII